MHAHAAEDLDVRPPALAQSSLQPRPHGFPGQPRALDVHLEVAPERPRKEAELPLAEGLIIVALSLANQCLRYS